MKVKLRQFFSIETKEGEIVVGPAELDLTQEEINLHAHKLEAIESDEFEGINDEGIPKEISKLAKKLSSKEAKGKSKDEKAEILLKHEMQLMEEFKNSGLEIEEFIKGK